MIKSMLSAPAQNARPKPEPKFPWSVFLPWALTAAVLVVTAVAVLLPRAVGTDQPPPGRAGLLVWGDAVFSSPLELEAWLRVRGASYPTWARRHPAGVKLLTDPPAGRSVRPAPSS
jgi:hypothetical protein